MAMGTTAEKSKIGSWGFRLALLSVVITVLAIIGWRLQVMPLDLAMMGLTGGAAIGAIAAILCLVGLLVALFSRKTGALSSLIGLVIAGIVAAPLVGMAMKARSVPPIHDISTDLQDPPTFVQIVSLRGPEANSLDRSSPTNLDQLQSEAYPQIKTLKLNGQPGSVFETATEVARDMGWDLVNVEPAKGIIEATATTAVMGFKDDIVIRVREDAGQADVDVRSVSRVGVSDLGTNAKRIEEFLTRLQARVFG